MSSPGACKVLSTRSTVLVPSAIKCCVSASMTLPGISTLPDRAGLWQVRPYHRSLCSSPPCCKLAESSKSGIGRSNLGGCDIGLNLDVSRRGRLFERRRGDRRVCGGCVGRIRLVVPGRSQCCAIARGTREEDIHTCTAPSRAHCPTRRPSATRLCLLRVPSPLRWSSRRQVWSATCVMSDATERGGNDSVRFDRAYAGGGDSS